MEPIIQQIEVKTVLTKSNLSLDYSVTAVCFCGP